ncbi:hypothetical protein QAD02_002352 [Eretmocerus hayati]|uniref:Uncharacterized protein n=1 Tax=Eretmocerus hayati TaxID=131215 RepID=A0ACC2NIT1_9HYME|nr:hypothetical protein QAD02_002352 [Eretmocerus hayati]
MKAGADGKSNIMCITSIITETNQEFVVPEELQTASLHRALVSTDAYARIKNSSKKRHKCRNIWINSTPELTETYIDEAGNIIFADDYSKEKQKGYGAASFGDSNNLKEILEKLVEDKQQHNVN